MEKGRNCSVSTPQGSYGKTKSKEKKREMEFEDEVGAPAEAVGVVMEDDAVQCSGAALTKDLVEKGFHSLGKHPILQRHAYLGLNIPSLQLTNISYLSNYKNLMYLDISNNKIESLLVLSELPMLVQLNASNNNITDCLSFQSPLCDENNMWADGHNSTGSMLTLVNLSSNYISILSDLSHHAYIECLLLSKNYIAKISGFNNLQFLKVLDLSYNNIQVIEGLDNLNINELNLEGNNIKSLTGLESLNRLTVLNVAKNNISNIAPLLTCTRLESLDIRHNNVATIRQTELLAPNMVYLSYLYAEGNPFCSKMHYRLRIIHRLPSLVHLDATVISPDEKIRSSNLYDSNTGFSDIQMRAETHHQNLPDDNNFILFERLDFVDDEMKLTMEDLLYLSQEEKQSFLKQSANNIATQFTSTLF